LEEKERLYVHGLSAVYDLSDDEDLYFYAHWVWWNRKAFKVLPVGKPVSGGGLQRLTTKHPDQVFFTGQKLRARPHSSAAIVTDCRLLPCHSSYAGCAYRIPFLVADQLGSDIPIGCFAHKDYVNSKTGRYGFYTSSGATREEIDESLGNIFTWEWDPDGDVDIYFED
jgi:hypothetical protein